MNRSRLSLTMCFLLVFLAAHSAYADTQNVNLWWPYPGYSRVAGDGTRRAYLESNSYQMGFECKKAIFDQLYLKGNATNLMAGGNIGGISLEVITTDGQLWDSYYADGNASLGTQGGKNLYQVNIYTEESGREMNTAHVHTIKFKNAGGSTLAMEAEIIPYAWQDRIYFHVIFKATGSVDVWRMRIMTCLAPTVFSHFKVDGGSDTAVPSTGTHLLTDPFQRGIVFYNSSTARSLSYIIGKTSGTTHFYVYRGTDYMQAVDSIICSQYLWDYSLDGNTSLPMTNGQTREAYFQLYMANQTSSADGYNELQVEKSPLTPQILASNSGSATAFMGYDDVQGTYDILYSNLYNQDGAYRFSNKFQNEYETFKVKLPADSLARKNRFNFWSSGLWGGGVVCDEFGFPRGEPVTNTRTNVMNSYFQVNTTASTPLTFQHKIYSKRWGKNPTFYVSTENTIHMDDHGQLWLNSVNGLLGGVSYSLVQNTYSDICDAAAIDGNPKFNDPNELFPENTGGHSFLKYMRRSESDWKQLEASLLRNDRLSPDLLHHKYTAYSEDNLINASIEMVHTPFSDVTRHFYHLRYDVTGTVLFDTSGSPMKSKLRLFSLGDEQYGQPNFSNYAYTNSGGTLVSAAWAATTGVALGGSARWVAEYNGATVGNRGAVVRSYSGRINGTNNNNLAFTLATVNGNNSGLWLVPNSTATQLINGDYFDLWIEVVLYGTEVSGYTTMQNEAAAWGGSNFNVTASEGTVQSVMPPRLLVNGTSGQATFTVTGGKNFIPLDIGDFSAYTNGTHKPPILEEQINSTWVPVDTSVKGNDGWDVFNDPATGNYRYLFSVFSTGGTRTFRASLSKNRLEAEDYTSSSDTTTGNSGGLYRADNVDVYASDAGGYFVGLTAPNEWLQWSYTLSAARRMQPTISYRCNGTATAFFTLNGVAQASFTLPPAATWTTLYAPDLAMASGANTIRLTIDAASAANPQLDYVQLNFERPAPSTTYNAVIIDDTLPVNINNGETLSGTVTVKNIGTGSWAAGTIGLKGVAVLGTTPDYWLPVAVPAGGTYTFNVTLNAPTVTHVSQYLDYITQWQMQRSGNPNFGAVFNHEIRASALVGAGMENPTNPGFESGSGTVAQGWIQGTNCVRDNGAVHNGSWAGKTTEQLPATDNYFIQDFVVKPNTNYELSGWYNTNGTTIHTNTRMLALGQSSASFVGWLEYNNSGGANFGWTQYKMALNTGNNTLMRLYAGLSGTPSGAMGTLFMDDFALTAWPGILNTGFENGTGSTANDWTPETNADRSTTYARTGTYSGRMQEFAPLTTVSHSQYVSVQANTDYIFKCWYRTGTTPVYCDNQILIYGVQSAGYVKAVGWGHSGDVLGWTAISLVFNSGSNTLLQVAPRISGTPSGTPGIFYWDDFSLNTWPESLDGGFEEGGASWSRTSNANVNKAVEAHGGSNTGELAEYVGTTDEGFYKEFDVEPGKNYEVNAWFKSGSNALKANTRIKIEGVNTATTLLTNDVTRGTTFGWTQQYSGVFSSGANTRIRVWVGINGTVAGTAGLCYVDDIKIAY